MTSRRYGKRSAIIYRWLIDPLVQPLRPKIVSLCLKHNVRNVLDIGCATGAQCRRLGAAGIRAVGLDLSEAMIAAASRRVCMNTTYVVGSAFELPFAESSFDGAILSLALHEHTEAERETMIKQALRVIKPEGVLLVAEYSQPKCRLLHIPWLIIRLIENLAGTEHRNGFRQFIAADGLDGLLARHGLRPIESATSHFGTLAIAVAEADHNPLS